MSGGGTLPLLPGYATESTEIRKKCNLIHNEYWLKILNTHVDSCSCNCGSFTLWDTLYICACILDLIAKIRVKLGLVVHAPMSITSIKQFVCFIPINYNWKFKITCHPVGLFYIEIKIILNRVVWPFQAVYLRLWSQQMLAMYKKLHIMMMMHQLTYLMKVTYPGSHMGNST